MILTIRTTTGRENASLSAISTRIQARKIPIKSLFFTDELKGYLFIEGESEDIENSIKNIPHVRGLISKEVDIKELEKFLIAEKSEIKFEIGDIIEVVGGPFKGEKAKITRMDEAKSEITIELLESVIPIPVTISMSIIRLYEKKK
ncbi:MAG: transcription elongation factor Spt5 [Candidatus Aenigmatarchaeota archaeon]